MKVTGKESHEKNWSCEMGFEPSLTSTHALC
ncbi:hypothetical protein Nmel_014271, partial [Mimus melanotis]